MVEPNCAGDRDTKTPADSRAANFSLAPPFPPDMIAPACPMNVMETASKVNKTKCFVKWRVL